MPVQFISLFIFYNDSAVKLPAHSFFDIFVKSIDKYLFKYYYLGIISFSYPKAYFMSLFVEKRGLEISLAGGNNMDNLFDRIQALCNERGIRPGRLCDELGLSRSLMTDLKMGRKKTVNAETAQKIATYFGVSVGYLLGHKDEPIVRHGDISDVLDEVDVAFYGEYKELNDEEKETVRDMVRLMRERRAVRRRE